MLRHQRIPVLLLRQPHAQQQQQQQQPEDATAATVERATLVVDSSSGRAAAAAAATAQAENSRAFTAFTVNIILSTILFMVIFVAGTSWTMAVNKQFENHKEVYRYWVFAGAMTAVTIALSIGFGELSKAVGGNRVQINANSLFGPEDSVIVE